MDSENSQKLRSFAWRFVLTMGLVSLFADITYEGARGMLGPWLSALGASAVAVSAVSGLAECLGLVLRVLSGRVADRFSAKWPIVFAGYAVNLGAVPLIGLALNWPMAAACVLLERFGKAVRAPARDALLAQAGSILGTGKSFAVHEAMDQIGAVAGPLAAGLVLAWAGGYRTAFLMLAVPAMICLMLLLRARADFPGSGSLGNVSDRGASDQSGGLAWRNSAWWGLLAGAAAVGLGMADFPLIAFHLHEVADVSPAAISLVYAGVMAVDALAALLLGWLFDRWGIWVNVAVFGGIALSGPLIFMADGPFLAGGLVLWGVGMGAQESVLRAAVSGLAPGARRATAYGEFYAVFGGAWLAGSVVTGWLYHMSPAWAGIWSACWLAAGGALLVIPAVLSGQRRR